MPRTVLPSRYDALLTAAKYAAEALDVALHGDATIGAPLPAGQAREECQAARSGLRLALARHGVVDCDDCGVPAPLRTMRVVVRGRGRARRVERHCADCAVGWGATLRALFRDHFGIGEG